MKTLFILNDPPYGTERCYNALRLAHALLKNDTQAQVSVFLMADAVVAARKGQKTPDGYYNVQRMLKRVLAGHGQVLLCGACMDARAAARWTNWRQRQSRRTRSWCFNHATHLSRLQRQHAGRSGGRRRDAAIS